jgi:hypothetical protein
MQTFQKELEVHLNEKARLEGLIGRIQARLSFLNDRIRALKVLETQDSAPLPATFLSQLDTYFPVNGKGTVETTEPNETSGAAVLPPGVDPNNKTYITLRLLYEDGRSKFTSADVVEVVSRAGYKWKKSDIYKVLSRTVNTTDRMTKDVERKFSLTQEGKNLAKTLSGKKSSATSGR